MTCVRAEAMSMSCSCCQAGCCPRLVDLLSSKLPCYVMLCWKEDLSTRLQHLLVLCVSGPKSSHSLNQQT
jgi:hypothetical protein